MEFVRVERDGEIAVIWIDRQDKLNALNPQVIEELGQAFDSVRTVASVRGVLLTGAGEKAFGAGADIGVLAEMTPVSGVEVSRQGQRVFRSIEAYPKPVVAAVGGYALGGGCELALACHLRVASSRARFGLPEVGLGIIPGYGGTLRLSRLVGLGRALEMTLTGAMVDAEKAEAIGLANAVFPAETFLEDAKTYLRGITKNAPAALRLALESVYGALDASVHESLLRESTLFGLLASTDDMREGMTAFLEKRKAEFTGS